MYKFCLKFIPNNYSILTFTNICSSANIYFNPPEINTKKVIYVAPILETYKYVDVICQYSKDGKIIPLRLRLTDEDGERQAFTIKQYRDLTPHEAGTVSDYVTYRNNNRTFECKIQVFGNLKTVKLFFNSNEHRWRII